MLTVLVGFGLLVPPLLMVSSHFAHRDKEPANWSGLREYIDPAAMTVDHWVSAARRRNRPSSRLPTRRPIRAAMKKPPTE